MLKMTKPYSDELEQRIHDLPEGGTLPLFVVYEFPPEIPLTVSRAEKLRMVDDYMGSVAVFYSSRLIEYRQINAVGTIEARLTREQFIELCNERNVGYIAARDEIEELTPVE